jgi:hypothetical protein
MGPKTAPKGRNHRIFEFWVNKIFWKSLVKNITVVAITKRPNSKRLLRVVVTLRAEIIIQSLDRGHSNWVPVE